MFLVGTPDIKIKSTGRPHVWCFEELGSNKFFFDYPAEGLTYGVSKSWEATSFSSTTLPNEQSPSVLFNENFRMKRQSLKYCGESANLNFSVLSRHGIWFNDRKGALSHNIPTPASTAIKWEISTDVFGFFMRIPIYGSCDLGAFEREGQVP